ncbi:MAG: DUF429 domain-containing protein [Terracidiphilus sp.]|jgi:predicted RNase H-like nuclease
MTTLLIGFDSAWTAKNSGALVGVLREDGGQYVEIGPPIVANFTEAERIIDRWKLQLSPSATVQLLDQPTIVNNATGQRPVENIVGSAISRRYGGMQPASKSRTAMFGDGAPVWRFLKRFGGPLNPLDGRGVSGVIETYPALAMIALGWTLRDLAGRATGRLPKYNPAKKSKFSIQDWRHVCASASKEFADRGLTGIAEWIGAVSQKSAPHKNDQDKVDACICLIVGFHSVEGKKCLMVGDQRTGCIVVPHDARLRSELEVRCRRTGRIPTKWVQAVRWSSG